MNIQIYHASPLAMRNRPEEWDDSQVRGKGLGRKFRVGIGQLVFQGQLDMVCGDIDASTSRRSETGRMRGTEV